MRWVWLRGCSGLVRVGFGTVVTVVSSVMVTGNGDWVVCGAERGCRLVIVAKVTARVCC